MLKFYLKCLDTSLRFLILILFLASLDLLLYTRIRRGASKMEPPSIVFKKLDDKNAINLQKSEVFPKNLWKLAKTLWTFTLDFQPVCIYHRCTVIFKLFWGGTWGCENIWEGSSIFVSHCIFMVQFFEVFSGGTWGAPSLLSLPSLPPPLCASMVFFNFRFVLFA